MSEKTFLIIYELINNIKSKSISIKSEGNVLTKIINIKIFIAKILKFAIIL